MAANYVDVVCDFIEQPKRAADVVAEERPVGLGVLAFIFAAVSLFLARALLGTSMLPVGPWAVGVTCVWTILWGFLLTGIIHLIAEMAGGKGSAASLFVLFGLSDLFFTLLLPAALILRLFAPGGGAASMLLFLAVGLAVMVVKARSIRDNYRVSTARAWFVLLAPYCCAALLVIGAVLIAIVGAATSLLQLVS